MVEAPAMTPQPPAPDALLALRAPGLTKRGPEVPEMAARCARMASALAFRERGEALWVVVCGGTGTGKSTLMNALSGAGVSEASIERPATSGAVGFAHAGARAGEGFPFSPVAASALAPGREAPARGEPGALTLREHEDATLSHLVLADTPDLDSLSPQNRATAADILLLADAVLFVTTEEKYADEVPSRVLVSALREGTPLFLVVNKWSGVLTEADVRRGLGGESARLPAGRVLFIPRSAPEALRAPWENPGFAAARGAVLSALSTAEAPRLHREGLRRLAGVLREALEDLLARILAEEEAAANWRRDLDRVTTEAASALFPPGELDEASRDHLAREVRRLVSRHDILSGPRRALARILSAPLRALGLMGEPAPHEETLALIRKRLDTSAALAAADRLERLALSHLSPPSAASALHGALRAPGLRMTPEELRERVIRGHEEALLWLEGALAALEAGLPAHKRAGMHGTSLLFAALLIVIETKTFGGFTALEGLFDALFAPFVTKGAAALLGTAEVRRIASGLAERSREAFLGALRAERDRYEAALLSTLSPPEAVLAAKRLSRNLRARYDV